MIQFDKTNQGAYTIFTLINGTLGHLVRNYTVCHTVQQFLNRSVGSKMEFFKFWDKYSKCPKILYTKVSDKMAYANSADPAQTAP